MSMSGPDQNSLRRRRDAETSHRVLAIAAATFIAIIALAVLLPRKPAPGAPHLVPMLSTSMSAGLSTGGMQAMPRYNS